MNINDNFATPIPVEQSSQTLSEAVINVGGWWPETFIGGTRKLGDEIECEVQDVRYPKQRLIKVILDNRKVWPVIEAKMTLIEDQDEWMDTNSIFETSQIADATRLTFTHKGLVPVFACYKACTPASTQYIQHGLKQPTEAGVGYLNLKGQTIGDLII